MIQCPGVEFDFEHSMVFVAGVGFPAVMAAFDPCSVRDLPDHCLFCKQFDDPRCVTFMFRQPTAYHVDESWEVMIPTENGALFCLNYGRLAPAYGGEFGLTLYLHSSTQHQDHNEREGVISMVQGYLVADGGALHFMYPAGLMRRTGEWVWTGCDAEWVAEHIQRLAKLPIVGMPDDAKRVELIPISDPRIRQEA